MAKAAKRSSPRKSLRVRSGVAVGSPEGDVRKAARDGGGGGGRERVWPRLQAATSDVVAGASSMDAGVGGLLMRALTRADGFCRRISGLGLARAGWWVSRPAVRGTTATRAGQLRELAGIVRMRGWGQ